MAGSSTEKSAVTRSTPPAGQPAARFGDMAPTLVVALAALALASCAGMTGAGTPAYDDATFEAMLTDAYKACMAKARAMRPQQECHAHEEERQDAILADEFQTALLRRPGQRQRMEREQAAWKAASEARCTAIGRLPGSMHSLEAEDCFLEATIQRRIELAHKPAEVYRRPS